jgi:homoserine O-acetyltransferase/O-succinyltransferase
LFLVEHMEQHIYRYNRLFQLEMGGILPYIDITYFTAGTFEPEKNNVVWACHTLTSTANIFDWWAGLFGKNDIFNPQDHFIVCATVLGSCYGTTGPSDAPDGYKFHDFPKITIRDMVRVHDLLREYLGISQIQTLIGASSGGSQALEWAVMYPNLFDHLIVVSGSAARSPWAIALSSTQRMAIEADPTWKESHSKAGLEGLKTARAIAMISYRSYDTYALKQREANPDIYENFAAERYQRHHGNKIVERFDAFTYYTMTLAMDTNNVGRGRGGLSSALGRITAKTLIIAISTDILFPVEEQYFLAEHIKGSQLKIIESPYGHDGFLVEMTAIASIIKTFFE